MNDINYYATCKSCGDTTALPSWTSDYDAPKTGVGVMLEQEKYACIGCRETLAADSEITKYTDAEVYRMQAAA